MENKKADTLYQAMLKLPVDYHEVEGLIIEQKLSATDIAEAMIRMAEECMHEDFDILDLEEERRVSEEKLKQCHSNYLIDLTRIALRHGFDPDCECDCRTFTDTICWIGVPYVAADLLNILLEAGADITKPVDGESPFDRLTFDIEFGAIEQDARLRYDATVHLWFVMLGSGIDAPFIRRAKNFDLKKLRNHRDYDFCLAYSPNDHGTEWSMRIFDRYKRWEVCVY